MEHFVEHVAYLMTNSKGILWIDIYNAFRSHGVGIVREAQILGEFAAHKMYSGVVDFNQWSVMRVEGRETEWEVYFSKPPILPINI